MIRREDLLSVLRATDDRFAILADDFLAEWEDDEDTSIQGLPYYILIGEICHVIVDDIKQGNEGALRRNFAMIEDLHLNGDHYVREAATIGLLETIQNLMGWAKVELGTAYPYLGKESRKWWDKVIRFWNGDPKALQDD